MRKILLRDGCSCGNPRCRRRLGLQAHHIIFRSCGGRTALYNEVIVCPVCHALLHCGLLKVEGDPMRGLSWTPKLRELSFDSAVDVGAEELANLPRVIVARADGATMSEMVVATDESTPVDSVEVDENLVDALRGLGYRNEEARNRVQRAYTKLCGGSGEVTDEEILAEALRCRGAREPRQARSSSKTLATAMC